ncbi:MAG: glutamate synthase [Eubacteriaceae bacterium]|jgi:glutamate synthase domain-containing protein 3
MRINAKGKYYTDLNREVKKTSDREVIIDKVLGQRYIGTGVRNKEIIINGTPGNALGAYLMGTDITVHGNVQDAVGDTMDSGEIIVHGSGGDTVGYGMRGGAIYIRDHAGYRIGIHMKAYQDHQPVIVVGGSAGSFLGEYQAGGTIIVLGLDRKNGVPAGGYLGTGMHGGSMYIRSYERPRAMEQVTVTPCTAEDLAEIMDKLEYYCSNFDVSMEEVLNKPFWKLTPGKDNPYNGLYTAY